MSSFSSLITMNIPIFPGQGSAAADAHQTRQQALRDAASSSGSIILSACHEALHTELSTLPLEDFTRLDINLADFKDKNSLLALAKPTYRHNPILSGTTLFLIQTLRYLAYAEDVGLATDSLTPFRDVLKGNAEPGLGILGFSSGILSACVVGTSPTLVTFLSHAIETFRLAIWIGIRSQLYRKDVLDTFPTTVDSALPWTIVILETDTVSVEKAMESFVNSTKGGNTPTLYISAHISKSSIAVSGHPDILSQFFDFLSLQSVVALKTSVDSLYHYPLHADGIRKDILADVSRRNIRFPQFSEIDVPIRDTSTGDLITKSTTSGSLVEIAVDLVITRTVNWDLVVEKVVKNCPAATFVRLLNVGPGAGLARGTERFFSHEHIRVIDLAGSVNTDQKRASANLQSIAIVGMAVNMPGAPSTAKLWEILEKGINMVTEIPKHRFKVSDYKEGKNVRRSMKARTGNFVESVDEFDNRFFNISPREARSMDPQQRILLHTVYEALENSGYVPNATPQSRPESVGCYIGAATHDYRHNLENDIDVYYSTGTLNAFLSGRISYAMQLSGPSIVVDTACSSSNVALYLGVRALMHGDCDAAIVGGVNVISSPDMFLGLDRAHFLSPTGQCKAFDASADGYSRGEGCGVFILKRLSEAISSNDNILGVIRGVEVNQSGLAQSITRPHIPTQAALFQRLLTNTGIEPHRINLAEAHGTGTQSGDRSEMESIRAVFANRRHPDNPLHITSIKSNIGHLEAASGAAGLAKLLLMLRHRTIPRQISLKTLNPAIAPLESDGTIIDTVNTTWFPSHDGMTRMALLNNFGAAGSNTALLLEEFSRPTALLDPQREHSLVFGVSAKDISTLEQLSADYIQWLQSSEAEGAQLKDIAYTMTARRQIYRHRLCVSAGSKDELVDKLKTAQIVEVSSESAQIAFVFSGQGSQYHGMGSSLYSYSESFRRDIDRCHSFLTASGFPGIISIIKGEVAGDKSATSNEFEAYQTAVFTLEYALAQLWISWGIVPACVVGHSLGEYAALVVANVLTLEEALLIVASRAQFMKQQCHLESTGMIAVNMGTTAVEKALQSSNRFSDLSISCYNSPVDCTVSGPISSLHAFKEHLDSTFSCKNVILSVPFGYHSNAMVPLVDNLTAVAKRISLNAPSLPIVSNVLGKVVQPGDRSVFTAEYFSRHCVEPVQFEKGISALTEERAYGGIKAWVEIGPHTASLSMLKSHSGLSTDALFLPSLRKHHNAWSTLTAALSQLYLSNIDIRWREVFAHVPVTCIGLPSYPFTKSKFWVHFQENGRSSDAQTMNQKDASQSLVSGYSMLHVWSQYPTSGNDFVAEFQTPIDRLAKSICGHIVVGVPLCPASVYIEQALAGIKLANAHRGIESDDSLAVLGGIKFEKPLVYDENIPRTVITRICTGSGDFSVSSCLQSGAEEVVHVKGTYRSQPTLRTTEKFSRALPVVTRHAEAIRASGTKNGYFSEMFSTRTAYEVIFPRVVDYAPEYRTMRSLTVDDTGMEGCAAIQLPPGQEPGTFIISPVFTDTLLHVPGFIANLQGDINDAYICSEVGSVKIDPSLVDSNSSYLVYCNNAWLPEERLIVAEAYAVRMSDPKKIVAHFKGMHFRRVRLSSLKRSLLAQPKAGSTRISNTTTAVSSTLTSSPKADSTRGFMPATSDVNNEIARIFSHACGIPVASLDPSTDFKDLGVDSLMLIEIFMQTKKLYPSSSFDQHTFSSCRTLADIVRSVSESANIASSVRTSSSPAPSEYRSVSSSPKTLVAIDQPVELDVKQLMASILCVPINHIADDTDFEFLGLDSLTSIEAVHSFKSHGIHLPQDFFVTHRNLRSVQSHLSSHMHTPSKHDHLLSSKYIERGQICPNQLGLSSEMDVVPVLIQQGDGSGGLPLFLFHDGSGLVNYYDRLSPINRTIWAFPNPRFATGQPWEDISQMAASYAQHILSMTQGPVILGGWSFGGVVAYEIALQLAKTDIRVQGILLIDSPNPIHHVPLSDNLINAIINVDSRTPNSEFKQLIKAQFTMNTRLLGQYHPRVVAQCPTLVILRSSEGYRSPMVQNVPDWLVDRSDARTATQGWDDLAGTPLNVLDIPGNHFEPFQSANVREVSRCIADSCKYIELSYTAH